MIKFLDLQKVTESHGAEIREAVDRVISSGWYLQGQENARFEAWARKPRSAFNRFNERWDNRKVKKYFKCAQCGQPLSVPKGKGTLRVTCPKCHATTTVKS